MAAGDSLFQPKFGRMSAAALTASPTDEAFLDVAKPNMIRRPSALIAVEWLE
jgi:hypothetical protein